MWQQLRRVLIYAISAVLALSVLFTIIVAQNPTFILPYAAKEPDNVEAVLRQLVETRQRGGDVEAFAQTHNLYVKEGMVRVVIELQAEDAAVPDGYGVRVEARQGRFVQAMVPVDEIVPLSASPHVEYISVPKEPVAYS